MKDKVRSDTSKTPKKKITVVLIVCAVMLIAILLSVFGYFASQASTDKIYEGVYAGNIHLGGLTRDEAERLLEKEYKISEFNPIAVYGDVKFEIYASQISLDANFKDAALRASELGKDGSVFGKIINMQKFKKHRQYIDIDLSCDMEVLQHLLNENLPDAVCDVQPYTAELGDDCLIVTNSRNGKRADAEMFISDLSDLYDDESWNGEAEVKIVEITADKIDIDKFCDEYNREPVNAVCNESENEVTITPEVVGIRLDKSVASKIIEENSGNSEPYKIPAEIIQPEITAASLEAEFTDTIIGSFYSDYSDSTANRKENIRLASSKINGMILNPGEVFSFNGVVGPRTAEAGFKVAHVYSGTKVVDGIGGGICQVSSTLYNAVVFADLEIVYRTNHSIPVSYAPLGRDATVSYGTIDFKFKNNKPTPVKLEIIADGSRVTVNVYGRRKYLKDISIETAITGTTGYSVNEIKDDTLYEDERVVVEKGANGTKVEAYKVVKEGGNVVSRTHLTSSNYSPSSETVKIGTKKRPVATAETSSPLTELVPTNPETQQPVEIE